MKLPVLWLALGASASLLSAAPAPRALVEDNAYGYAFVADFPTLRSQLGSGALGRMWADEKLRKFFAPALSRVSWQKLNEDQKARTGLDLEEWFGFLQGEALLALVPGPDGVPAPVLLVEVKAEGQKLETAVQKLLEGAGGEPSHRLEVEDLSGLRFHTVTQLPKGNAPAGEPAEEAAAEENQVFWFVHEGVFAVGPQRGVMQGLAEAVLRGQARSPLGGTESFQRLAAAAGGGSLSLMVDFNRVVPAIEADVAKRPVGQGPEEFTPPQFLRTLSLRSLDSLELVLRADPDALRAQGSLRWHEEKGLVTLLALAAGNFPTPSFVPANWVAVSSSQFSLLGFLQALKALVQSNGPVSSAIVTGKLAEITAKTGIDLEREVVGSLAPGVIQASAPQAGVSAERLSAFDLDAFYAFPLADARTLSSVIERVVAQIDPQKRGLVQRRDFMDTALHSVPIPPDASGKPRTLTLAVWQNHLLVSLGTHSAIEQAIKNGTERGPSFWDQAVVRQTMEKIPSDAQGFSFQDNRTLVSLLLETFVRGLEKAGGPEASQEWIDPSARPSPEDLARYWSYSYGYMRKTANAMEFDSVTLYSSP